MLIMLTSIVPIVIYGVLSLWLGTSQRSIVAEQYRFIMSQAIVYQITGFLTDLIKTSVSALRPDYLARYVISAVNLCDSKLTIQVLQLDRGYSPRLHSERFLQPIISRRAANLPKF